MVYTSRRKGMHTSAFKGNWCRPSKVPLCDITFKCCLVVQYEWLPHIDITMASPYFFMDMCTLHARLARAAKYFKFAHVI